MTLQISFGICYLGKIRSLFTKALIDGQEVNQTVTPFDKKIDDWRIYHIGIFGCLEGIPESVRSRVSEIRVTSSVPSNVRSTLQKYGIALTH